MSKLSFFLCAVAALLLSVALAQTRGGTLITNTASVSFTDSDGNDRTTESNTVEIFVQTVYSFNIEPDEDRAPSGGSATVNDFAGYNEIDTNNDFTGAVGEEITFEYTLTNDTNNSVEATLEVLQATTDDFNLSNVTFAVREAVAGAGGFSAAATGDPLTPVGGVYTLEQNGAYTVTVTGTIPAGAQGNQFALIDLVATNTGVPITAAQRVQSSPATGPNVSYENNNVSRVTVAEIPVIGAANTATSVNNGDGSYTVTYTLSAENFSNTALNGVQITDNLDATFGGATSFSVTNVTSTDFTVNPGFTGRPTGAEDDTSLNLLAADQSLATSATGTVTLTVRVVPGANLGPYNNQVTALGITPGGVSTRDDSTNSDNPDQNGAIPANDGDGDPRNTNSLTPVTFTETPVLGVAKGASAVTDGPNGTFDVTYTIWLQNSGNVALSGVQVTDALTATFPAPATFTVGNPTTTGNLTPNTSFDGDADTNLLGAGSTLAAGATETVSFTVSFVPNGLTGPFENSAEGSGNSPAGVNVTDVSQNGDDPDPENDGPGDNSDPTPISLTENPVLGVAKDVNVTDAGSGTFTATFTVTVENLGNVNLNAVQVTDNLNATFPDPATFSVSTAPSSPTLTPNPDFNGDGDTALLAGTDVLTPGQTAVVTFSVTFDPNGRASFENTANGSATSPEGLAVNDGSQSGTDPDPDGNGSGADNTTPTPVIVPEAPAIGLAKALGSVTNNGDGSYTVPYTLTAENFGNVKLNGVQITDDFSATFAGATFTVDSVSSDAFNVNTGFNGGSDRNLLAGSNSLAVGAQGTVVVTVTVTPGANLGPYNNQANASATSPGGATVTDASTSGDDPDANGNGNPTDDSAPTPVTFAEAPALGVAKAATESVSATGFPGQFESTVTITLRNLGDVPLNNVSVTDNLDAIFTGEATVEAVTGVAGTGTLQANTTFNGGTVTELLLPASTLPVGATETVTFTVRFDPNGETGPFNNTATGSASSPAGTTVTDDSTLGSDPVAGDAPAPTPITFTANPVIGVAKAATVTDFGNANPNAGPVTPGVVELTFTVENLGDVNLTDLSLTDDLNTTFGPDNYTVTSGPTVTGSTTVTASTAYDGGANTELLAAGSSLDIGETATVTLTVSVSAPGAYTNQAAATGTGPGGATTTDLSDNGTDPDEDGDGIANEEGENDPTPITFDALRADKSARVCADANCNDVLDPDADGGEVAPGQYIEYTITAENLGGATLTNVTISDLVPASTEFANSSSVGAQCSVGGTFGACPTDPDGDATVTEVRLPLGALDVGATADLVFTVLVP